MPQTGRVSWCVVALVATMLHTGVETVRARETQSPAERRMAQPAAREDAVRETAGGYRRLQFAAPIPGSYELPPLGDAADAQVLDTDGRTRRLHELFDDKIIVLSFIYTSCSETNGCPLATFVLGGVQSRLLERPDLRERVRLLSVSFDPEHDTPQALRRYAERVVRAPADWSFLTTASEQMLDPLLAAYGQTVSKDVDASGRVLGTISHMLRVFLIDRDLRIRNIYSSSFLHADTLFADIETLSMQHETPRIAGASAEDGAALARRAAKPPLGLPPLPAPDDNPITADKVALGRSLFFDRRLSRNGTISCAMCHVPAQGFTSNEMATAVGIEGRTVKRNTPTLYNVAYAPLLFHDGRESTLEQQIWGPLLAANEMGNPSIGYVLDTIRSQREYDGRFEAAFGGRGPTMETVGMALASFERTLLSGGSPFDRWKQGGAADALDDDAIRGFSLFTGKAGCAACHTIGDGHAVFSDFGLHHTGVGLRAARTRGARTRRLAITPTLSLTVDADAVADASEVPPTDLGRYEVTDDPDDRWKYKTPSLRNVELTAPYMHDGSFATLREVVEFYDRGGEPNELIDARIHPLGLRADEIDDLVAFLRSLTGADVAAILTAVESTSIGDPAAPRD